MPHRVPPKPILTVRTRCLRKDSTDAEAKLWHQLRNRQFFGLKFKRQVPLGNYIADFFCEERGFIIEADGEQHGDNKYDHLRDAWLLAQGYVVMRFWNHEILKNLDSVLATIARDLGIEY